MANLNQMAKRITLKEGKKIQVNIGQVKEVMRLMLLELKAMKPSEVLKLLERYR